MAEFYDPRLAAYLFETTASSRNSFFMPVSLTKRPAEVGTTSFLDRSDAWLKQRDRRRNELIQREITNERRECVFVPAITRKAKRLSISRESSDRVTSPQAATRLAADASRRKTKFEALRAEADERKVLNELEECTFRPRINASPCEIQPLSLVRVDRFIPDDRSSVGRTRSRSADGIRRPQLLRGGLVEPQQSAGQHRAPSQTVESAGNSFAARLALYERRREQKLNKTKEEVLKYFTLSPSLSEHSRRIASEAPPFIQRVQHGMRKREENIKAMRHKLLVDRGLSKQGLPSNQLRVASSPPKMTVMPQPSTAGSASKVKELSASDDYRKRLLDVQRERERMAAEIRAQEE